MFNPTRQILETAASAQWAIAKGHLQACVAILGSQQTVTNGPSGYESLQAEIDVFVRKVEDHELHLPEQC